MVDAIVDCGTKRGKNYKFHFRWRYGLYYDKEKNQFSGHVSDKSFNRLAAYCRSEHLKCYTDNDYGKRSSNYRTLFFQNVPPDFGNFYFCVYCGLPYSKKHITVDHLIPIGAVKDNLKMQHKLKRMGIPGINDCSNLVPACRRCNQRKGKKMGIWLLRARIGRHKWVCITKTLLRALTALGIVLFLIYAWRYLSFTSICNYISELLTDAIFNVLSL